MLRSRIFSLLVVATFTMISALSAFAQPPKGQMNPPALPATDPLTNFGAAKGVSTIIPPLVPPTLSTTIWTAIGPASLSAGGGNVSGRIAGLAVDPTTSPNVIFVAAAGGGVWKSTNDGATYTPLTDNQIRLPMGAIAISPTNHLKIYAGTGEGNNAADSNYGDGILVSSDGGSTWTLTTGPGGVFSSSRLTVSQISVDPSDATGNTAYAAMGTAGENPAGFLNTGVYKTTTGGTTWTNMTAADGKNSQAAWSAVVVDPNTPTTVYAAYGYIFGFAPNGVYRSLNSGTNWTLLTSAPNGSTIGRIALAVAPSANQAGSHVLYVVVVNTIGNAGGLYQMLVSNNADAATPTFINMSLTPDFLGGGNGSGQGWYDVVVLVNPSNAADVYAAGVETYAPSAHYHVIRTTNGTSGATAAWTDLTIVSGVQPHTDSHAMTFDSSGRLLLGNDGGLWRFDPLANTWTNLNGNLNTIQFTGIGLHPTSLTSSGGGSQDNGTEVYSGSVVWNETDGGDGGLLQISQTTGSQWYHIAPVGSFGSCCFFRVSSSSGALGTWNPAVTGFLNSNSNFYPQFSVDPSLGSRLAVGLDRVYLSTNSAGTWSFISTPGSGGFNSTVGSGGSCSATINCVDTVAVAPSATQTIYAATGGGFASASQIFVTANNGTLWTEVDLPPTTGRVNEIDVDPNDPTGQTAVAVISTFNTLGTVVYRTANRGALWTNISGNLPVIPTWSAKIGTDVNKTIYVSNETGVYSSPSPYGTWTAVGTGLPNAQAVHLQLNNSLGLLAVATHGRGMWELSTTALASPTIAKAFNPSTIQSVGGSSTVTLTLSNSNASALTGAAFTDTLVNMSAPSGPTSVTGTCVGTTPSSLIAGQTSLSFSGITIPASGSCTVIFGVVSSTPGVLPNSTSGVTTTQTPTAGSVSNTANLTVLAAPTISKAFNPTSIASGGTSVVTLTLTNSNASALTGGAFTDTLTNMSTAAGSVTGTCTGTTPTSFSGGQTALSFTGINIPTSASCTVIFSVTSTNLGGNNNQTSGVTTTQTSTAGSVSNIATLTVTSGPTVVSYNVICGTACQYNMVTSSRVHLPWQITGVQVVFSQVITSANVNSLTGVSASGFSGLGTNTLTWTFTGVTNGNLATALATTGGNAIQSAGGALSGSNTSFGLKILQGDMNDDGVVNASDLVLVNNARSQAYNIFADINGDGVVNTADVLVVQHQLGQSNH